MTTMIGLRVRRDPEADLPTVSIGWSRARSRGRETSGMPSVMRICPSEPLQAFSAGIFTALGAEPDIAAEVASHLIRANLSGHDSHGVIRIAQYVKEADGGELEPAARPTVVRETEVAALMDAHRSFGQYSTLCALDWALGRVQRHGLAAVAVRHSTHIGRLGEYTERAAERGMIAVVTVGAAGPGVGAVALHGAVGRFLATNPWSVGVPAVTRAMVFDAATSVVAEGKVRLAHAKGTELPAGCLVNRNGQPTRSPGDYYEGGSLLPLGGDVAGHKGYGLGLASALIGGLSMIDDPDPARIGPRPQASADARGRVGGVFLLAIDPGTFGNGEHYRAMVEETLAAAKRMPPASGRADVLVPGEPEVLSRHRRTAEGIGVPEATWTELAEIAARFHIPLPENRLA
jgi:hydroxycarboxylate dehydrogenase B